jgi:hypothetical protein
VLPNAEYATIEDAKVRDYLLSSRHPTGRFKSRVFLALGYSPSRWQQLRDDLLDLGRRGDCIAGTASPHGRKFAVSGTLLGPKGASARIVSIWIIATDTTAPRFVTAYPE